MNTQPMDDLPIPSVLSVLSVANTLFFAPTSRSTKLRAARVLTLEPI